MKASRIVPTVVVLVTAAMLAGCVAGSSIAPGGGSKGPIGTSHVTQRHPTKLKEPPKEIAKALGAQCANRPTLTDVYHPYRLKVIDRCLTVIGTVAFVRREPDGDWHVNIKLPANDKGLLDKANYRWEHGDLVTEIVPADQAGCGKVGAPARVPPTAYRGRSYNYGTCSGLNLTPPAIGTRVAVTGPYVLDSDHGWREIHPLERIQVVH